MVSLDLSQLNTYFLVFLPMIVAFVAGVIRQDRFPQWVNECITIVLILGIAVTQAVLSGKVGGSPLADFGLVAAYTTAFLHTPLFQQLQSAIQTHVLSIGAKVTPTLVQPAMPVLPPKPPMQFTTPVPQPPLLYMPSNVSVAPGFDATTTHVQPMPPQFIQPAPPAPAPTDTPSVEQLVSMVLQRLAQGQAPMTLDAQATQSVPVPVQQAGG